MVQHDARWSIAIFFTSECRDACEEYFGPSLLEKTVDDGTLHLLCYQSRKAAHVGGGSPAPGVVIVAHSTIEWAKRHARAGGRDKRVVNELLEHTCATLGLRSGTKQIVQASKVITWKQCQVTQAIPADPVTGPCLVGKDSPPLVLAGDYFSDSSFQGCLESGFAASEALAARLE